MDGQSLMLLGRLSERSEAVERRVDRLERRVSKIEKKRPDSAETIGAIEKLIKSLATWLIPLGVAWVTGSLEAALKVAGLFR